MKVSIELSYAALTIQLRAQRDRLTREKESKIGATGAFFPGREQIQAGKVANRSIFSLLDFADGFQIPER